MYKSATQVANELGKTLANTSSHEINKRKIVKDVIAIYKRYISLKKSVKRDSLVEIKKRNEFIYILKNNFEISTKTVKILTTLAKPATEIQPATTIMSPSPIYSSSTETEQIAELESDYNPLPKRTKTTKQHENSCSKNILTPDVAVALDRAQLSNSKAAMVLSATSVALGVNIMNISLSMESIRRARIAAREQINAEIRQSFQIDTDFVIHWDGKILPDLTGSNTLEHTDRLAIVITCGDKNKLLGVPKICNGTGRIQAEAVYNALQDWNVGEKIIGFCFDTTASNTGSKSGTCSLLAAMLKRPVLHLACRHHIHELLVAKAFTVAMGDISKGPEIVIFKRFKNCWSKINHSSFQNCLDDNNVTKFLNDGLRRELLIFIETQLTIYKGKSRADYIELLQLSSLFLGYVPKIGKKMVTVKQPGALHRARWMAKIIYSLKIYLYRDQFKFLGKSFQNFFK